MFSEYYLLLIGITIYAWRGGRSIYTYLLRCTIASVKEKARNGKRKHCSNQFSLTLNIYATND